MGSGDKEQERRGKAGCSERDIVRGGAKWGLHVRVCVRVCVCVCVCVLVCVCVCVCVQQIRCLLIIFYYFTTIQIS